MMSVALMSDVAKTNIRGKEKEGQRRWGKARLGQEVLIVELVMRIRKVRLERESRVDNSDDNGKVTGGKNSKGDGKEKEKETAFIETAKYISALEGRLGILLDAKVDAFFTFRNRNLPTWIVGKAHTCPTFSTTLVLCIISGNTTIDQEFTKVR